MLSTGHSITANNVGYKLWYNIVGHLAGVDDVWLFLKDMRHIFTGCSVYFYFESVAFCLDSCVEPTKKRRWARFNGDIGDGHNKLLIHATK